MEKNLVYLALDVDDVAFHAYGLFSESDASVQFACRPNVAALRKKIEQAFDLATHEVRICYEATHLGFALYRDLVRHGFQCEVIAPTSIPKAAGQTVKNDRIDCERLAFYFRAGLLTKVHVPDAEDEKIRDLIRSRKFLCDQLGALRRHTLALCRRAGMDYKAASALKNPSHWTQMHVQWLKSQVAQLDPNDLLGVSFGLLLSQTEQLELQIALFDEKIKEISERTRYKEKVTSLRCYRGIDTLSAMLLVTEIGDIRRFSHPRQLTSYVGFDLREYSSGGKEQRYSISKMGNARLRTALVESCQQAHKVPQISSALKKRRESRPIEAIAIADRCMKRLYKRSQHLLHRGKHMNKVKVACARELLAFVWESLRVAEAV